jgi:E3 ubiquitin-protein ligase BOI-like protein
MEKVRMEIEEKRKRQARRIVEAIELGMMKRLKAKEEEIEKIGKLNWALEERVKSLCIENQIWRDLAQTNEATANALRSNLEQVLAQVKDERTHGAALEEAAAAALMDDAQSCCGSSGGADDENEEEIDVEGRRKLASSRGGERIVYYGGGVKVKDDNDNDNNYYNNNYSNRRSSTTSSECGNRWCRNCGKQESCVLLLPCRHLCLCTVCGSTLHICPICKSTKNASVHVNMS